MTILIRKRCSIFVYSSFINQSTIKLNMTEEELASKCKLADNQARKELYEAVWRFADGYLSSLYRGPGGCRGCVT